jgi:SAM-dependent methyltransferase
VTYTFGDNNEASRRLRRLAELYEPETRELLLAVQSIGDDRKFSLAVDLGCGPGWSTQLLEETLHPQRTVGLEASETYLAEARANHPRLEFFRHDVLAAPFPVAAPDLLFCRFLLTHLSSPRAALESWASAAARGAILAIHETKALDSAHPAMARYYEMVGQMQKHHGQELNIGAALDAAIDGTEWKTLRTESVALKKPARAMAELHAANLRTWGKNEFALAAFGKQEIDRLERELHAIAAGEQDAGIVVNTAKRIIAER